MSGNFGGRHWKAIIGFVVSGVALWWVFRHQDLAALVRKVGSARPLPFALATVAATAVFWIRAWRWKALLHSVNPDTSFRSRFAATTIGFMGNNVFPWRLGEVMRPIALSRAERLPLVACITSLVLERLLDILLLMGLLFLSMGLPGLPAIAGSEQFTARLRTVGLILCAGLVLVAIIALWPALIARLARALLARAPARLRGVGMAAVDSFIGALRGLREPGVLLRAGGWSVVLWLVNAAGFWLAMRAFDLRYSFTAGLFFQGILALAVAAPSAPGFFGVYEFAAAAVLVGMWHADATTTNAFAAAYHIAGYIPVTVIGLYYAERLGVKPPRAAEREQWLETEATRA